MERICGVIKMGGLTEYAKNELCLLRKDDEDEETS